MHTFARFENDSAKRTHFATTPDRAAPTGSKQCRTWEHRRKNYFAVYSLAPSSDEEVGGKKVNLETLESRRLLASSIAGFVFNDANANGVRDAEEKGLKGTRVYLDVNHD